MTMDDKKINLDNLLKKAETMSVDRFEILDTDKIVLDLFKKAYEKYGDLWILQTQVLNKLNKLTNVRNRMEKLAIKGLLESRLFDTRKVYRLKVKSTE